LILDGRNRWLACERAGIEPWVQEVETDDPDALAWSLNESLLSHELGQGDRASADQNYQFSGLNYQGRARRRPNIPGPCQPGARLPLYADNSTTVDVLVDLAHTTLPLPEYGFIPTPLEITVRSPSGAR
jgi:hypothetical protein